MKEWMVLCTMTDGEEGFVVFNSFWRLILWFLRWSWRCSCITIRLILPAEYEEVKEDPCETCLRWEECNGVDRDICTNDGGNHGIDKNLQEC